MRTPPSADEARPLIDALIARRFDGELPPLSDAVLYDEVVAHLDAMPLAARLPLHGRALFASGTLDAKAREHAGWTRTRFFADLGAAFGVSARVVLAAVRARQFPLAPPRAIPGHDYLGAFTCTGRLDVADPCLLRRTSKVPPGAFSLSAPVDAIAGRWHAYARNGVGDDQDRTAELVVVHADGLDLVATTPIATIGVDAGMAGVFDHTCPVPPPLDLACEGTVAGLGVFTFSGHGDGLYPVFAGSAQGRVAKLRLSFIDERPDVDRTMPTHAAKRYAVATTFVLGDVVDHPKFGAGAVVRAEPTKITVQFADETRTLVHAKR